jgi:flagellin
MALGFGGSTSSRSIHYMNQAKSAMDKSLLKISSGSRLVSPGDDPAGLAVSMKIKNEIKLNEALSSNIGNALSYANRQHEMLKYASETLSEMKNLKQQYTSAVANGDDTTSLQQSFENLSMSLHQLYEENFAGAKPLDQTSELTVATSTYGLSSNWNGKITLEAKDFRQLMADHMADTNISGVHDIDSALNTTNEWLAQAGSDYSVLEIASDNIALLNTNLQEASDRITNVDLAEETANYASLSMQYEAAAAAVAQANASADTVFNLLMGSLGKS